MDIGPVNGTGHTDFYFRVIIILIKPTARFILNYFIDFNITDS